MNFLEEIKQLPQPSIIEMNDFESLLAQNVALAKEVLGSDWRPLESDQYMKKIRVLTLRQMHNEADKNETIKQLLVTTATGVNLDHLGLELGVVRDKGEKPRALIRFSLPIARAFDIVIFAGTVLNDDDDTYEAIVVEDLTIAKGETFVQGEVELDRYVEYSDVKCENIVTDVAYVFKVEQMTKFDGGAIYEDDDHYRVRIILSLATYSTAGCVDAYEFYTRSADSRIDDVAISANDGIVKVVLHSFSGVDDAMIERVNKALNSKSVRPISDNPNVIQANILETNITLEIELYEPLDAGRVENEIRANFTDAFFIGQDLVRSDVMRKAHLAGVYRVNSDFTDVIVDDESVIEIKSLTLSFKRANP